MSVQETTVGVIAIRCNLCGERMSGPIGGTWYLKSEYSDSEMENTIKAHDWQIMRTGPGTKHICLACRKEIFMNFRKGRMSDE